MSTLPANDFYHVLGIPPAATIEQIKAAYRRLALRLHPDKNPDSPHAEWRFKQCSEAYSTLSHPQKRIEYDMSLMMQGGVSGLAKELLSDVLWGKRRPRRGRDLRIVIPLTLTDLTRPLERSLSYIVFERCATCEGRGAAPSGIKPCAECDGKGEVRDRTQLFALPKPCAPCGGQGTRISEPCTRCDGVGTVEVTRTLQVTLPAGVEDGHVELISGAGEPGFYGGAPGDLHLVSTVEEHPLFVRQGSDIRLEYPVSFAVATLGGILEVPTVSGSVTMRVPQGTQSGYCFRLKGKGLRTPRGTWGDQLVTIAIETPVNLTDEARAHLNRFSETCPSESMPRSTAFIERLNHWKGMVSSSKHTFFAHSVEDV